MRSRTPTLLHPTHRPVMGRPRPDVFGPDIPTRELGVRTSRVAGAAHPGWLFVAAHGDSGAGLLAKLSWRAYLDAVDHGAAPSSAPAFAVSAGRGWPNPRLEPPRPCVVVCRTSLHGLAWARDAAAQYLCGRAPEGLRLMGLLTIADQPGRLPPPLSTGRSLLTGLYAHSWHLPYLQQYRLFSGLPGAGLPPPHPAIDDVLTDIRATITREAAAL
jgi:hypothetical protein